MCYTKTVWFIQTRAPIKEIFKTLKDRSFTDQYAKVN